MVDIHHHLLAGLDDGSPNVETSVAMAKIAADDGITHIVCTPHANSRYAYDRPANEAHVATLEERLRSEGVPITLGLGCDFHLSYQNVLEALKDRRRFTINRTRYLLIELPDFGIPPNVADTFLHLQEAGLQLILTHPERNLTLSADPERMLEWLRCGLLIQVTADSVTGEMGRDARKAAHDLLRRRWVHFIASDAHNTSSRPPRMKAAHDLVARKYGAEYAARLCVVNPRAVFLGEPIPIHAGSRAEDDNLPQRSWLRRLFGR